METLSGFSCIPSIASADQLHIAREIDRVRGVGKLHLDIEDGNFVPNITFGMKAARQIAEYCGDTVTLDAHLITARPELWVEPLASCNVKRLAVHMESSQYPLDILSLIKAYGMAAGLALNFATPVQTLEPFLERLDYILMMTAEPDGAGQLFYAPILRKLEQAAAMAQRRVPIWVDGGVDVENIAMVARMGATVAIVGRSAFDAADPAAAVCEMEDLASRAVGGMLEDIW